MYGIIVFFLLLSALILIAVQKLSIKISVSRGYRIEFDYSVIALVLKKSDKSDKKYINKANAPKKKKRKNHLFIPLLHSLRMLISRSTIILNDLHLPRIFSDPKGMALQSAFIQAIVPALLVISENSNKFTASDNVDFNYQSDDLKLDFSIETSLFHFCVSVLTFLYELTKTKIKGMRNERKQSE